MSKHYDLIVVGGGAAGIFGAIEAKRRGLSVVVLEKTEQLLSKVKISGGGRCNVTHHCFDPKVLVNNYPRGQKELISPFFRFGPEQTIAWFTDQGVELKVEKDGRIFPITDSSQTIIECLLSFDVEIKKGVQVEQIEPGFVVHLKGGDQLHSTSLLLATGGNRKGHALAHRLGHTIVPPVPSLFTMHVPTSPLKELSGVAAIATVSMGKFQERGPVLITHFGFSGPAIIKLSAWVARELAKTAYKGELRIKWHECPKRLEKALSERVCIYQVEGKTLNKQEFVTAGGVELKEVNFKTMESKVCPGLYFAGEVLDIDGITGGFNFQNAWTTAYIAAHAATKC